MTSWLLFGATEGGLFDLDATLPLMAVQVVLLTLILNALFFRPVGRTVEEREGYITTSRADAKQKLAQVQRLQADLKEQLKDARKAAQALILEASRNRTSFTERPLRQQRLLPMRPGKPPAANWISSVMGPSARFRPMPRRSET